MASTLAQEADTIQLNEVLIAALKEQPTELPIPPVQTPQQAMDLLDAIPGVVRAQQSAFPISYRGQHGSRLRIQQNGARRAGLNPQGYLGQDLNASNLEVARMVTGIERAIYGSGSIGGVLLLEDAAASAARPSELFFDYGTNNRSRRIGMNWQGNLKKTHLRLAGSGLETNNFRFADQQEAINSNLQELNLSSALSLPLRSHEINWRQNLSSGNWQFPQGFQNFPFEFRDLDNRYTYQTDLKVKSTLRGNWTLNNQAWGLTLKTDQTQDKYNAQFDAINEQVIRRYTRNSFGYNGSLERITQRFAIKTGMDLYTSRLEEHREDNNYRENRFESRQAALRDDFHAGSFLRVTTLNEGLQWTGVIRVDMATSDNLEAATSTYSAITGGIQADWTFLQLDHQVYVGRFFRFPRPEESGGELQGGRGVFRGNPDIKPEYSTQLEWSVSRRLERLLIRASSWFAYYQDRIVETPLADENAVFLYDNVDQARTFGIEWSLTYTLFNQPKQQLTGSLSGLAMKGDDLPGGKIFEKGERSLGIPPATLSAGLQYVRNLRPGYMLNMTLDVRHAFEFIAPAGFTNQVWAVSDAPDYTLLGFNIGNRFRWNHHDLLLNIGASNLTDVAYFPFGTRIMGMGRNWRFGVKYAF